MRKYVPPFLLFVLTVLWEFLIQFSTIVTLTDKLRTHGSGGVFMAELLLSPIVRLALIVVCIILFYRAYKRHGTHGTANTKAGTVPPASQQVSQTAVNAPQNEFNPHNEFNPTINVHVSQTHRESNEHH